jgi:peptidyl-prolyl cis-trans isomerase C
MTRRFEGESVKRKIATVVGALVLAGAGITTWVAVADDGKDPVVMKAGSLEVRQSEFEAAIDSLPPEYQAYVAGPGKRAFADDYLRLKLLAAEAVKNGVDKKPEVAAQLRLMRDNTLANAEVARMSEAMKVAEADVRKAYDAQKAAFETVNARHILIAFQGSPAAQPGKPELSEEQALAKAQDLRKKIVAGGDFAALATAESDDTASGARGGDLGAFGRGQMVPEFENAAFSAKPGEVSQPIRTQFGYHLIRVDAKNTRAFDEVKGELEQEIRQQKIQEAVSRIHTGANATLNEAYFGPAQPQEPTGAQQ